MMTKQDFIALADALKAQVPQVNWSVNKHVQWELDCNAVARVCKQQNNRFNKERWLGYLRGECGPNGGKISRTETSTPGPQKCRAAKS